MIDHALNYAARGWYVFPLQPGSKIPEGGSGAHKDATNDPEQIKQWWQTTPNANIGISLEPSGLVVLDVDRHGGVDGVESLRTLHTALGGLPPTLTAHTPRSGIHAVYSRPSDCPAGRKIDFLHRLLPDVQKAAGLDLLGKGYIVASPSVTPDGGYRWADIKAIAPLPKGLVKVYSLAKPKVATPELGDESKVGEGSRDNALFRLACALRDTGMSEDGVHAAIYMENKTRCVPPLEDDDVSRILHSALSRVVPTRDVLQDALFETAFGHKGYSLDAKPGFLSLALDQIAAVEPPPIHWRTTGWPDLDAALGGGFAEHNMSLVIGPPGSGKSGWAIQQAMQSTSPGLYISTELPTFEIRARLAAVKLGVPVGHVMGGRVAKSDVHTALSGANLWVLGSELLPRDNLEQLLGVIRKEIKAITDMTHFAPTVYVDYLQDIARRVDHIDSSNPVGKVSMELRDIAMQSGSPVIAVSSTARHWYGQKNDIPDASGFLGAAKGDGDLDFDATNVLYLDVLQDVSRGYKVARIAAAKSRHGPGGFIGARYHGSAGGRWEADPTALGEFTKDKQTERKRNAQNDEDKAMVLKRIRDKGPDPKRVLVHNCGIPQTRAKNMIEALLAEGLLEMRQVTRINNHHKSETIDVVGLPVSKTTTP